MKHYFSTSSLVFLLFISINILSSCRDQNYDWNAAKKDQRVEQYEESFKSIFGDIDPQQSWDFSVYGKSTTSDTRAGKNNITGYSLGDGVTLEAGDFGLPSSALSAAKNLFDNKEGIDITINNSNAKYARPDVRILVKGKFTICPYYRGICDGNFVLVIKGIKNGKQSITTIDSNEVQKTILGSKATTNTTWVTNDVTDQSEANKPKGWVIDLDPETEVEVYMQSGDQIGLTSVATSLSGFYGPNCLHKEYTHVLLLDHPTHNQTEGKGCDYDCDLALMIKSEIENNVVKDNYDLVTDVAKRYMIEDLGTTASSDIDFNDIVVDFYQEITTKDDGTEEITDSQVKVVALGGTLDFSLCLLDNANNRVEIFKKSGLSNSDYEISFDGGMVSSLNVKKMYNTGSSEDGVISANQSAIDYNSYLCKVVRRDGKPISLWNPENNNICIIMNDSNNTNQSTGNSIQDDVDLDANSSGKYVINFPNVGEVPAIIAFGVNKQWRLERDGITSVECKKGGQYYWFSSTDPRK